MIKQISSYLIIIEIFLFSIIFSSCKEEVSPAPPDPGTEYSGPYGTVTGRFTTPSGVGISGVTVLIQSSYTNLTTVLTDSSGSYIHGLVPAGNITLLGKKGNFSGTVNISVPAEGTTSASNGILRPKNKMAYVKGSNDRIEDLIFDLGYNVDSLDIYDLGDDYIFSFSKYSAVYLNCGVLGTDSIITNLLKFVRDGGLLYATDWSYFYIEKLLPGMIDFEETGDAQEITAQLIDTTMKRNLGMSEIRVVYDLGSWASIATIDISKFNEILRGTYVTDNGTETDQPIAIYRKEGNGFIVYTTFHNESNVTEDMTKLLEEIIFL